MRNEEKYPTVRFLKCKNCGHIFTESLSGENQCSNCQAAFQPEKDFPFWLEKQSLHGHVRMTIMGTLYKIKDVELLKVEVAKSLDENPKSLAFEFKSSSYLDSTVIHLLAKSIQRLSQEMKKACIITDDEHLIESLRTVGLDRVVSILPNFETYQHNFIGQD